MICKKCGKDTVIEEGDHYVCTNCKARAYKKDTDESVENRGEKTLEEKLARAELEKRIAEKLNSSNNDNDPSPQQTENKNDENNEPKQEIAEKNDNKKSDNNNNDKKKKKSKLKEVLDFFLPIVIALVIALLLKQFVFANAVVPTGSMLNTIQEGDRIIASRLEYKFNDPQRFDIIIFKYPDDESQFYVKRIIGMPGETVQVVRGVVYVTNKEGVTTQLTDDFVTVETPRGDFGPYVVPEDSYFVMGDNRNNSLDSRYWETTNYVAKDKIIGKVKFRYFPSFGKLDETN